MGLKRALQRFLDVPQGRPARPTSTQLQGTQGRFIDDDGTIRALLTVKHTFAGPASYSIGGISVDLSAKFSRIIMVVFTRAYTTSTKLLPTFNQLMAVEETGTDLFTNGKFRAKCVRGANHTHTYDKANTPTGTVLPEATVGATAHSHTLSYTATASGSSNAGLSEIAAGNDLSLQSYEFLVLGVPK